MPKQSAGILAYRFSNQKIQVFLAHPGGPFFKNKDAGVWSIPKGEFESDEEPLAAAKREFAEEIGQSINGNFRPLTAIKYKNGKLVHAWAVEAEIDHTSIQSNYFEIEWPPRSGKMASFVEIDRADWFDTETAKQKLIPAQVPMIDELIAVLNI